jgi:hypothetical protein
MHARWHSAEAYEAMRRTPGPQPFLEQALTIAKFESARCTDRRYMRSVGQRECPVKGTHIHPIVIGCTSYSIVPDGTLHQTGFVFGLFEKDQTTGRFKFPLQVDVPRIPKETIGWDAATGGFAD